MHSVPWVSIFKHTKPDTNSSITAHARRFLCLYCISNNKLVSALLYSHWSFFLISIFTIFWHHLRALALASTFSALDSSQSSQFPPLISSSIIDSSQRLPLIFSNRRLLLASSNISYFKVLPLTSSRCLLLTSSHLSLSSLFLDFRIISKV